MEISQARKEGMYANWNNCLNKARGEFVYIATSDDTMEPQCLQLLTEALREFPQCDIATCNVDAIDEQGKLIAPLRQTQAPEIFLGKILEQRHLRYAPHDVPIMAGMDCLPVSVTGAMFRRTVFDKVGLFSDGFGSAGDYHWHMQAAFCCHKVHIPQTLATWRIHGHQATVQAPTVEQSFRSRQIVRSAFGAAARTDPKGKPFDLRQLTFPLMLCALIRALAATRTDRRAWPDIIRVIRTEPRTVTELLSRLLRRKPLSRWLQEDLVRESLHRHGLEDLCVTC
jgi:hypothetical protein